MTDSLNPIELLQRGQAAARVGHRQEARRFLQQALELEPGSVEAWLALAGVEDDPAAKAACFKRALALDPDHMEARLGLEMLGSGGDALEASDELEAVIAAASHKLEQAVGPAPAAAAQSPTDDEESLTCANHPSVQTVLRCNRCGKPICTRCAVRTPVGYRCRQCVGQQQAVYFTGGAADYVVGGIMALLLGGVASFLMTLLGGWFFSLILGPAIGIGIAELVRLAVRRRRSRYLWLVVAGGIILGSLPSLALSLIHLNFWPLLSVGLFLVLAVGAASARLR